VLVKRASALSAPHALRHEAVLSRTVKRMKRFAVRAHRHAVAGCAAAVPTARQVINAVRKMRLINSSPIFDGRVLPAG
jgi:hypothetical protein